MRAKPIPLDIQLGRTNVEFGLKWTWSLFSSPLPSLPITKIYNMILIFLFSLLIDSIPV